MKTIQIREYGTFVVGEKNGSNVGGNITLTKRTFEQLENFILSNSSKETDALELMGLSARRGVQNHHSQELCWHHYHERWNYH